MYCCLASPMLSSRSMSSRLGEGAKASHWAAHHQPTEQHQWQEDLPCGAGARLSHVLAMKCCEASLSAVASEPDVSQSCIIFWQHISSLVGVTCSWPGPNLEGNKP